MDELKHKTLNERKWDRWADGLDAKNRRNDYLRNAQHNLIALLPIKEGVSLLDIGCGTGWAVGDAAKVVGDKGTFYGVDMSAKMVDKAKENYQGRPGIQFMQANAEAIPLADDMFDIIICTHSFHHYLHPDKALSEMNRLLKKGGRVYILDPTADSRIIRFADRIIRVLEPAHVKIYSTAEFHFMISRSGLRYGGCRVLGSHQKVHMGEKVY